jgi:hypothetical protein
MLIDRPKFLDSPFLIKEGDNIGTWYLKEGAPKEIREEFEKIKKELGPSKGDDGPKSI